MAADSSWAQWSRHYQFLEKKNEFIKKCGSFDSDTRGEQVEEEKKENGINTLRCCISKGLRIVMRPK